MKILDRPMTFNQFIFASIAVPTCYLWLILAAVLIIGGYLHLEIMDNIDKYITVLAILTAPATMIIFQITKTWADERREASVEKAFVRDKNGKLVVKDIPAGVSQHGVPR